MHSAIADKRDEIVHLCQRFGVLKLEVFGSAARGTDFNPETSDADFLVEFDRQSSPMTLDHFFDFRDALRRILGRRVDLIEQGVIRNQFLQASIDKSREVVHEA